MKIWRVSYEDKSGMPTGFTFRSTLKGAQKAAKDKVESKGKAGITEFEFPETKVGFLNFLNQWCTHPDNR